MGKSKEKWTINEENREMSSTDVELRVLSLSAIGIKIENIVTIIATNGTK